MGLKKTYCVFLLLAVFTLGCGNTDHVKIIRLAHGLDINHSVHKAMQKMAKDLASISKGTLHIEIYPNQQLGTEREILELMQIGSLDMTKVSVATLENFAPKTRILGLPYLFQDREHAFEVLDGPIGQKLLDDGEKYWLKGLGFYDAGSRSFYSKGRPIEHPDDLKGLKIRVMESVTAIEMVRSFGGSPTPISWGELYTSLQQGVVDGAENNPPSFYLSRHYEVCKYYSLNEHTFSPDVLIVGTRFWNNLSEQEKKWLKQAADSSIAHQRKLWAKAERDALDAVKKAGVEIVRPNKEAFVQKSEKAYADYKDDDELYDIIQQIQHMKK
ncbi:TRAP transporter substrate-binding protein [Allomuricauda sp. d1]|uniref:TRAP transporter substrate-binding protein n=1 Tax=Allomuricauda sp. d1 TaxID=3136725 RepID=UPI0031D927E9